MSTPREAWLAGLGNYDESADGSLEPPPGPVEFVVPERTPLQELEPLSEVWDYLRSEFFGRLVMGEPSVSAGALTAAIRAAVREEIAAAPRTSAPTPRARLLELWAGEVEERAQRLEQAAGPEGIENMQCQNGAVLTDTDLLRSATLLRVLYRDRLRDDLRTALIDAAKAELRRHGREQIEDPALRKALVWLERQDG